MFFRPCIINTTSWSGIMLHHPTKLWSTYHTILFTSEQYINSGEMAIPSNIKKQNLSNCNILLKWVFYFKIKYFIIPALNATEFRHLHFILQSWIRSLFRRVFWNRCNKSQQCVIERFFNFFLFLICFTGVWQFSLKGKLRFTGVTSSWLQLS